MIDLVIVSSAHSEQLYYMTQHCVDTFRATCEGDVVVVEDCFASYRGAIVIPQPKPFCYNRCLNEGFKYTATEWICFANNDVEFMPGWADIIHYGYDSVSPLNPGWFLHTAPDTGVHEGYEIGKHICGWCLVVKRSVIEKIGGFPEDVDFYYSDNIYADALRFYGIKHALVTSCYVKHKPSTTLNKSANFDYFVGNVQEEKYDKAKLKFFKL